ncbi:MAG: protein kinase [Minicystis sp.]
MIQAGRSGGEIERGARFAERYEVEAVLGRGGMGAVYRVRDLALGETIALKVLARGGDADVAEVLRFRQEVRLARKVTHPNVARVYDIGEHEGVVFLTMEIVEGETLRQRLRREGALPHAEGLRIALALAQGLGAAHAAGIVHRDLKPANVLLEHGGRVVITDFGIARSVAESSGLTVGAVGTPMYMAPEQLVSGPIDARTDVYALGLVMREMLTGERSEGTTVRLDLPPAILDLLRRCTAPLADARPASMDEVARALRDAGADGAAPVKPTSVTPEITVVRDTARDADTRPTQAAAPRSPSLLTAASSGPALAVLPFRYRGPKEDECFGDAITDELVDVLARTRGLRVLGSGATARYREARDPRAIGGDLGATAVIDGSAQIAGDRVRITVRLLDAATGVQIWTDRFDRDLGDLIALQESIANRVAEELRLELTTLSHRGVAPAAAIEHYLAGRHQMRAFDFEGATSAIASLDRCLALAPDFAPALAAHAIASLRCSFYDMTGGATDWEAIARRSVARALASAPELAETHLAAGILATHGGSYQAAARAIHQALAIAPTYADAHEYLGMLQCEAGRAEEGTRRLRLAASLDPTLIYSSTFLARHHALHGQWDEAAALLAALDRQQGPTVSRLTAALRVRIAAWRGDVETLRSFLRDDTHVASLNWRFVRLCAEALSGAIDPAEVRERFARILSTTQNPRFASLTLQVATEVHAGIGQLDEARLHLGRAATSVLVDLDWLEHCPVLAPLRDLPEWDDIRRRVRARAEAIWNA